MEIILREVANRPPARVLEVGAGNTTALLAALSAKYGFEVVSLENHIGTLGYVDYLLEGLPFRDRADIRCCGFARRHYADGTGYWWYDVDVATLGGLFDLVFVDGPMSRLVGRNGALPSVWKHLAAGWRLYLDDANRPHEKVALEEWRKHFPSIHVQMLSDDEWPGCLARITDGGAS